MRVDDPPARDYYIRECAEQGRTTRQLERRHILQLPEEGTSDG
jgi:predicted nuclease of restriction endonuclease-like (RecB) superfamily